MTKKELKNNIDSISYSEIADAIKEGKPLIGGAVVGGLALASGVYALCKSDRVRNCLGLSTNRDIDVPSDIRVAEEVEMTRIDTGNITGPWAQFVLDREETHGQDLGQNTTP